MAKINSTAFTKSQMIKNLIYSITGVDITNMDATLTPELEINDYDVLSGLTAYYTAQPITNGIAKQLMLLQTNIDIDLNVVKPTPSDEWVFMGILSEGRKFNMSSNLLDLRLTGIPLSFMYVNPQANSYYSTIIDMNVGKPEYFVDEIRNKIIITAGGDVVLSLKLCWMSTDLERVHMRHINQVAGLIAIPYFERLIALRGQLSFSGAVDYQVDIGFLQSKLEEYKLKNVEFLKSIRKYTILKG